MRSFLIKVYTIHGFVGVHSSDLSPQNSPERALEVFTRYQIMKVDFWIVIRFDNIYWAFRAHQITQRAFSPRSGQGA